MEFHDVIHDSLILTLSLMSIDTVHSSRWTAALTVAGPSPSATPDVCSAWTAPSQDKDLRSSLEQETASRAPPTLHWRAPLDGPVVFLAPPPLVFLLGFLGSGPPVMHAVENKLLFRDLFCCSFQKDWLLPSWPTGGPSLWCTDGLNCKDNFGAGFGAGTLKWLVRPLCRACWSVMVKLFSSNSWGSKPTRLSMEPSCPSSSDMLILQLQLPQSHVPADQLKVGCHCRCCSYGFWEDLSIILTCSCTTLSLASSRMYFKIDGTKESVMDP